MDSIERLDAYVSNKPTNMEVDGESTNYIDKYPKVLMLKEERTHWEPTAIVEATTKLKNWAWEGAAHPMEDPLEKFKAIEPLTPAKNIMSIPIEPISTSIVILVESIYDFVPIESILIESIKNSIP